VAHLLGFKAGLTALCSGDLEALKKVYNQSSSIDRQIEQALARLKFFEQQGSMALILGQTGLGKSSLLRLFIHALPHNRYHPLYLHLTPVQPNAFLRLIVTKLGERPRMGKERMLLQILERIKQSSRHRGFEISLMK
jgi:energy-coupling factor transporter ATP-binding protein EcfA2